MRVKLAYGEQGLWVDLPERNVTVVEPRYAPGLPDEDKALRAALRAPLGTPPLRELVKPDDTVAIVFSDGTRPQPRRRMLPVLLDELAHVPGDQICLINGLGTHRPNTDEELLDMLGQGIVDNCRVVQHDAVDESKLAYLGCTSAGNEAWVNAEYAQATVKIVTGFIEPHFFAGFSGGPKGILPAIAGRQSILANHNAALIDHPRATWCVTEGNPIWEEMREVALMSKPTFLLNVTMNRDKQISGVFAGDLVQAHARGAAFVASTAMVAVPRRFDIVISSNCGYPLDQNLYQAVKGMSAAARIVKPGGSIIVAAECRDGVPEVGEYGQLLRMASDPESLLALVRTRATPEQDQWQVQIQAQVQMTADVYVKSGCLGAEAIESALLKPCASVEETLDKLLARYGPEAQICVLPEGPMTVPYVEEQAD